MPYRKNRLPVRNSVKAGARLALGAYKAYKSYKPYVKKEYTRKAETNPIGLGTHENRLLFRKNTKYSRKARKFNAFKKKVRAVESSGYPASTYLKQSKMTINSGTNAVAWRDLSVFGLQGNELNSDVSQLQFYSLDGGNSANFANDTNAVLRFTSCIADFQMVNIGPNQAIVDLYEIVPKVDINRTTATEGGGFLDWMAQETLKVGATSTLSSVVSYDMTQFGYNMFDVSSFGKNFTCLKRRRFLLPPAAVETWQWREKKQRYINASYARGRLYGKKHSTIFMFSVHGVQSTTNNLDPCSVDIICNKTYSYYVPGYNVERNTLQGIGSRQNGLATN